MENWTDVLESKASIILDQIVAVRLYTEKYGEDTSWNEKRYFKLLHSLYEEEFVFANLADSSDLLIHLYGPAVSKNDPTVSIVADIFTNIRNQIRGISKSIIGPDNIENIHWSSNFDARLTGLAPGSLVVGIVAPSAEQEDESGQTSLPDASDHILESVQAAVGSLTTAAECIKEDSIDEEIFNIFPDPVVRDTVMLATSRLAPTGKNGIDRILLDELDKEPRKSANLTPQSRRVLNKYLSRPVRESETGSFKGVVREIDLDARRFEIRKVEEAGTIRCIYDPAKYQDIRKILDAEIKVSGSYETGKDQQPRLMSADEIKIIHTADEQSHLHLDA